MTETTATETKPAPDAPKPTTMREIARHTARSNTRQVFDDFMEFAKIEDVRTLFDILDAVVTQGLNLPQAFAEGVGLDGSWTRVDGPNKPGRQFGKFSMPPTPEFPGEDPEIVERMVLYWRIELDQFGRDLETAVQMFRKYPDLVRAIADGAEFPPELAEVMREENEEDWKPFDHEVRDRFLDPDFACEELQRAREQITAHREKQREQRELRFKVAATELGQSLKKFTDLLNLATEKPQ